MAWLESHQELATHPKVKRAARALGVGVPAMIGHLHLLWWWCLDYAKDGDLDGYEPADIADAALWDGDPLDFLDALLNCGVGDAAGFLDRDGGRLSVHDWDDFGGKTIGRMEAGAKRQAAYRARTSRPRDGHVTGDIPDDRPITSRDTSPSPDVLNKTEQNKTKQGDYAPPTPPPAASPRAVPKPKERERGWVERHPLYPPLEALFGRPAGNEWGALAADIRALEELGATPEEIPRRAENYVAVMGNDAAGKPIVRTRRAVVKHWHLCGQAPARASPVGRPGSLSVIVAGLKAHGDGYGRDDLPAADGDPVYDVAPSRPGRGDDPRGLRHLPARAGPADG